MTPLTATRHLRATVDAALSGAALQARLATVWLQRSQLVPGLPWLGISPAGHVRWKTRLRRRAWVVIWVSSTHITPNRNAYQSGRDLRCRGSGTAVSEPGSLCGLTTYTYAPHHISRPASPSVTFEM